MAEPTEEKIKEQTRLIWAKIPYHLSDYAYIIIVYGTGLVVNYLIFSLISYLLQDDIENDPLVKLWFERAKLGIALFIILFAFVDGILSTAELLKDRIGRLRR